MVLRPRRWLEEHLTPSGTTASRQGPQLCLGSPSCPPLTPSSGKASRPLTARPRHMPRSHPHPRLRFLREAQTLLSGPLWRSLAHLHSSRPMCAMPTQDCRLGQTGSRSCWLFCAHAALGSARGRCPASPGWRNTQRASTGSFSLTQARARGGKPHQSRLPTDGFQAELLGVKC